MKRPSKNNIHDQPKLRAQSADRIAIRPDLNRPVGPSRNIQLSWLFENLSQTQFETVMEALRRGDIESKACVGWLYLHMLFNRMSNKKTLLTKAEWEDYSFGYRDRGNSGLDTHLIDSTDERAFVDISLNSSQVNHALKLTGQRGGQPPKMGPRLYAYLTAWYAFSSLQNDPEVLFAVLAETPCLWENGEIDDARGIPAIKRFLSSLEEFAQRDWSSEGL